MCDTCGCGDKELVTVDVHERVLAGNDLAAGHNREHFDIEPPLYALWLNAALATARDSDPDWSPDVERAWRQILDIAIRHMARRYET